MVWGVLCACGAGLSWVVVVGACVAVVGPSRWERVEGSGRRWAVR